MGRLSNEAKAEKARQSLIETIAKINDLEPTLGGKWKEGMLAYYVHRLAELVLYQAGFAHPTQLAITAVGHRITSALLEEAEGLE